LLNLCAFKQSLEVGYLVAVALLGISLLLVKPCSDSAIGGSDQSIPSVIINE
jgi:hypothetical protein